MDHYSRSALNTFAGLVLNRKPLNALDAPAWEQILISGRALYVVVRGDEILFDADRSGPLLLAQRMLGGCDQAHLEAMLLGDDADSSYFAINFDRLPMPTAQCLSTLGTFVPLRQHAAVLPAQMAALLGYARAIAGWHSRTRFCSLCGHPVAPRPASLAQVCTNPDCAAEHFPRINPAMIVLIHHTDSRGDWCLLGRQAAWKPRVYAAISGYVEPGESAEDAVLREVMEETGIAVQDIRYHSSQPWPFSGSLMLGFHARATSTRITLNDDELEDARWFSRHEIPALLSSGELILPAAETIARHLFEAWYESNESRS
jgi:NAD+ diphosphatase